MADRSCTPVVSRRGLFGATLSFAEAVRGPQGDAVSPIVERYSALTARLNALPDRGGVEAHFTPEFIALDHERCVIVERLGATPAKNEAERKAKASVAADWFNGHEDDLGDRLVASLLSDLGQRREQLDRLSQPRRAFLIGGRSFDVAAVASGES